MILKPKVIPLDAREAMGFRGARNKRSCFFCNVTEENNFDENGKLHVHDELHRIVEGVKGEVGLEVIFEPRLNYATSETKIEKNEFGVVASNGNSKLSLSKGVQENIFKVTRGKRTTFVLSWNSDTQPVSEFVSGKRLVETTTYWKSVVAKINYDGQWRQEVKRSFLLLHLLFY
ncbi:hypothetical protein LCGC14_2701700, partial [marine sediment metagenome]